MLLISLESSFFVGIIIGWQESDNKAMNVDEKDIKEVFFDFATFHFFFFFVQFAFKTFHLKSNSSCIVNVVN